MEEAADQADAVLNTRIIEIPVYYQDPWTHETLMRFRERHQDPDATDIEYAARINGYSSVDDFIKAHSGAPWFVSMVGFVSGLPFLVPDGRPAATDSGAEISPPTHRHAETDGRLWRLLFLHLLSSWRRRLPDVRHYPNADFRPRTEDQLSEGFHGVLQTGRHRQMEADFTWGI